MLRVGLTGSLGSGKSTVAAMLRSLGAVVIEADALGRDLMEPGHEVFDQIVTQFGPQVLSADGRLNRPRLAEIAFREGRLDELNAIVHPAVIDLQRRLMNEAFARNPKAVAVIESALIFEVVRDARARGDNDSVLADWRRRIDRIIVITAPDDQNQCAKFHAKNGPSLQQSDTGTEARGSRSNPAYPSILKTTKLVNCCSGRPGAAKVRSLAAAARPNLQNYQSHNRPGPLFRRRESGGRDGCAHRLQQRLAFQAAD